MKVKFFTILMVISIFVFGGIAQAGINDGLVAYYPFNGNAKDMSGNGNDGTTVNVTLTTDKDGNADSAYLFNGSDSYIITNYTGSQNVGKVFTISLWTQWNGANGQMHQRFIAKWSENDIGEYEYMLYINEVNSNMISMSIGNSGNIGGDIYIDSSWHMLTAISDGNTVKFYLDGTLESETAYNATVQNDNEPLIIGAGGSSSPLPIYVFNGKIDDIRIYNRALSSSEIQELYQGVTSCTASNPASVDLNLDIHIPSAEYQSLGGTANIWLNLEYKGIDADGDYIWKLKNYGGN